MTNNSRLVPTAIPGFQAGTWKLDPDHCEITFSVRQMGTKVRGRFTAFDATIVTGEDPLGSSVTATIELASLDTGNAKRDEHIRSDTFLDVAKFPTATYRSTDLHRTDDGWTVDGVLTLHGVSQNVPLALAMPGFGPAANGGRRARFVATAQLSRGRFGIDRWTGGGLVVSDRVPIRIELQAVRQ